MVNLVPQQGRFAHLVSSHARVPSHVVGHGGERIQKRQLGLVKINESTNCDVAKDIGRATRT